MTSIAFKAVRNKTKPTQKNSNCLAPETAQLINHKINIYLCREIHKKKNTYDEVYKDLIGIALDQCKDSGSVMQEDRRSTEAHLSDRKWA